MQSDQRVIPNTAPASTRLAGDGSAAGEVHGHFEADTQVGEGGFGPHRESPLVVPEDSGMGINAWGDGGANATFEVNAALH
jgi:hypothetical protein